MAQPRKRTSLVRNAEAYNGSADAREISAKIEYAAMAQQVEHVLGKDEVTGSNPVSSSRQKRNGSLLPFLFCLQPCEYRIGDRSPYSVCTANGRDAQR